MKEQWNKISSTKRLIAGILVTILVMVLIYSVVQTTFKPREEILAFNGWIYGKEDQKTATTALVKAGLSDYRWDNGKLCVPKEGKAQYESILADNGAFPKAPSDTKRDSLRDMSQFESEAKTHLRDLYSNAWQLEQTIQYIETIQYATVGVRTRREQVGLTPKNIVTATIGVSTIENVSFTPELLTSITLAAKNQLGIEENANITILDLKTGRSYLGTEEGVSNSVQLSFVQEQMRQEKFWNDKLRSALNYIPEIQITTTVDLDPVIRKNLKEIRPQSKPVTIAKTTETLRYTPQASACLGNPWSRTTETKNSIAGSSDSSADSSAVLPGNAPPASQPSDSLTSDSLPTGAQSDVSSPLVESGTVTGVENEAEASEPIAATSSLQADKVQGEMNADLSALRTPSNEYPLEHQRTASTRMIGGTIEERQEAPYQPRWIVVNIGIPENYLRQRNPLIESLPNPTANGTTQGTSPSENPPAAPLDSNAVSLADPALSNTETADEIPVDTVSTSDVSTAEPVPASLVTTDRTPFSQEASLNENSDEAIFQRNKMAVLKDVRELVRLLLQPFFERNHISPADQDQYIRVVVLPCPSNQDASQAATADTNSLLTNGFPTLESFQISGDFLKNQWENNRTSFLGGGGLILLTLFLIVRSCRQRFSASKRSVSRSQKKAEQALPQERKPSFASKSASASDPSLRFDMPSSQSPSEVALKTGIFENNESARTSFEEDDDLDFSLNENSSPKSESYDSMREEVNELINKHPDQAAQIIQRWIRTGS